MKLAYKVEMAFQDLKVPEALKEKLVPQDFQMPQ